MDKIMAWWYEHDPREQMMIAVGGAVAAIVLFILFVVIPIMDWHAQEKKRLEQAKAQVVEVQGLAARVLASKKASKNSSGSGQGLAVLIDSSLRKNELVMRDFQPGRKKDARLRLENAPYPALMQWLYDLEYQHSVKIEELSLTPAKVSGRLMVSVRVAE